MATDDPEKPADGSPERPAEGAQAPAPTSPKEVDDGVEPPVSPAKDGAPAIATSAPAPVKGAQALPAATKAVAPAASGEARAKDVKAELKALAGVDKPKPKPASAPDAAGPPELPTAPPWWKTLRADPPAVVRAGLGIGLIGLILLLWWLVTRGAPTDRIVSPSKLPSPGEVFSSFGRLVDRGLVDGIMASLDRVFKGVGLAALIGISIGVVSAAHRGIGSAVAPLVIFLRSVPMGALIPLTLMLFADGEKQKWMFIFLAIVPFVFSDTVKAVSIVPERYVETAQTLGASRFQIIRKVLVPLALPDIITSLRFQLGLALGYIMLVEIINAPKGIGALFLGSERQGLSEHTYLLLFVVALIAFTLDIILRTLQRGMFAWRKDL